MLVQITGAASLKEQESGEVYSSSNQTQDCFGPPPWQPPLRNGLMHSTADPLYSIMAKLTLSGNSDGVRYRAKIRVNEGTNGDYLILWLR
jgi:hypothetical protein